jgi:hypothetical protein
MKVKVGMWMMEQNKRTCIICDRPKAEGIMIYTQFICLDCEQEMVQTDVLDAKYPIFISRMRQAWFKKDA